MDTKGEQTRNSILMAAGELFAEHGRDGVKVRAIASAADVNAAAINYYFGSKDELYFEAVKYVCKETKGDLGEDFEHRVEAAATREELLELLNHFICEKVNGFLAVDRSTEPWKRLLALRMFLDDTDELKRVIDDFRPEFEAEVKLFRRLNPDLTREEATLTVFSMIGQLSFYVFARSAVTIFLEIDDYSRALAKKLNRLIYQNLQVPLNLPSLD